MLRSSTRNAARGPWRACPMLTTAPAKARRFSALCLPLSVPIRRSGPRSCPPRQIRYESQYLDLGTFWSSRSATVDFSGMLHFDHTSDRHMAHGGGGAESLLWLRRNRQKLDRIAWRSPGRRIRRTTVRIGLTCSRSQLAASFCKPAIEAANLELKRGGPI